MTVVRELVEALRDGLLVIADAARLLWRHWPALLTLFLLGLAVRNAAMWAAVVIGRDHPVLASLMVPLAPLAMVAALVVMLRVAGQSARWRTPGHDAAGRLTLLTSALVPFLTVYALQGHLRDDTDQFINESYADEFLHSDFLSGAGLDDRTLITVTSWQVGLIVVVLLLRTVFDRLDLEERSAVGGVVVALVEVTWLTWLATLVTNRWVDAKTWFAERKVVDAVADGWRAFTDALGPLTSPVRWLTDLLGDLVDRIGSVLVTPVAWLAVGAVVLAGGLRESRRARIEEHRALRRLEEHRAVRRLRERTRSRIDRWSTHRASGFVRDALGRRFEDLVNGLRTIAHAGLLPVVTFCLVLPLAQLAEWGAALGLRALVGPRDPDTMIAFSPYLDIATRAVYTVVVVVLVAAAVDRLLSRTLVEEVASSPVPSETSR